jgi:protease I
MAGETLQGMKVAILVRDGFEPVELTEPRKALDQAGADTRIDRLRTERDILKDVAIFSEPPR